jgi:hypothetical protein
VSCRKPGVGIGKLFAGVLQVAGRDNFNQVAEEPEVIPSLFVSADALGSI